MKKYRVVLSIFIFLCVLSSCSSNQESLSVNDNSNENIYGEICFDESTKYDVLGLVDDKLIYFKFNNNNADYHLYDIATKKTTNLGRIINYKLSSGDISIINNDVFYYVSVDKNGYLQNCLYKVDLMSEKLKQVQSEQIYMSKVYHKAVDDHILALKAMRIENMQTFYIESYNTTNNKSEVLIEKNFDRGTNTGEYIVYPDYSNGDIYLLTRAISYDRKAYCIEVYSSTGEIKNAIDCSAIESIIGDTAIARFNVFDDYIYIQNLSGVATINKIIENKIHPLVIGTYDHRLVFTPPQNVSKLTVLPVQLLMDIMSISS